MNLANCEDFNLPITDFNDCEPVVNFSEIERIFIGGPKAAAFANIANAAEWATRMNNATVTADSIRGIVVIGDMPAAANVTRDLSNGRRKVVGKDFTVNFSVDDMSQGNYDFFREIENSPILRLFGFETQGQQMYYYGNDGLLVNYSSNVVLARGRDEIETEVGTITWRTKQRPQRMNSPIYEGGASNTPTTFDTEIVTASSATPAAEAGIGVTAGATDAEQKFEFNAITPLVGTPMSMTITVGGVEELVVDYTSDYNGSTFKYTTKAGAVKTGTFINGTRAFTA